MAGSARFQFVAGRRRHGVNLPSWPTVSPEPAGADREWCAWRLLGGNNRELGRSARLLADPVACRSAVETLRGRAADLVAVVVADTMTGRWSWRLDLDGGPVVVSARSYHRQREAQYNLTQFLSTLPDAVLGDGEPTQRRGERPAASWPARGSRAV